jgi:hypothetical protein
MIDLGSLGLEPFSTTSAKVGETYGSLTIEAIAKRKGTYRYVGVCRCACGTFPHLARIDGLKNGSVTSCGCAQLKAVTKHGIYNTRLYRTWQGMMARCYKSERSDYRNYGGRGILVCERWHDLNNFVKDMEGSYIQDTQIDRIDNDKGYSPENCRWVTASRNCSNQRRNVRISWNGKTQTLTDWARELNVPHALLRSRVQINGWTIERAFTTPSMDAHTRLRMAREARSARRR